MEFLNDWLPIVIYVLLIILIIALIVFVVKSIKTLKKVDAIVDDVDKKMKSLNGVFEIIDLSTNALTSFGEKIASGVSSILDKLFKKKKKEIDEEE